MTHKMTFGLVSAVLLGLLAAPRAASAQTLISQGKTATASSVESAAFPASAAVDGNTGTRWSSAFSDPQWIQVDLGATYNVTQVVLTWEAAYGRAYQLQISSDAATWTTVSSTTTGTGGVQTIPVTASGRYVRVYGTVRATAYGYSLWELQVYGSAPSTQTLLSQGKPATASSVENAGTPASAAVDGNTGTRWSSAFSDPQWLRVDLGASSSISQVVLSWEAAYGRAFQIQTSPDGAAWTTIFSTTTGTGGVQTLAVSGSGRYVRMYGTARGTGYGYSLWEFRVYGGGAPPPSTCATLPLAPGGLAASNVASNSVTLSWGAPSAGANCTITGYRVYQNGALAASLTGTTAAISGLAASTTYSFTVSALNAFGEGLQSGALPVTTASPTGGEPPGFWDTSNIPVARNVMMLKFLNRTNGKYPDTQLFWAFTQSGATQVHSFAAAPTFDMPANSAGRMYFYVVTDPTNAALMADPTRSPYYDFIEFTIGGPPTPRFNGNTTRVDAFGLKLAMRLRSVDGDDTVGEDYATFLESREATFARFIAEVPAEFAHLAQPPFAPYRIVEPTTGQFKQGGTYQTYMDSWVDQLWASNGLTVPKPTYFCNPIAQPDLSAACMRHVGLGAFNSNGTLKAGNPLWSSPAAFYGSAPTSSYARFWHAHALGNKAYGFPYDDVGGYSSFISHPNPAYLLVAVGW
jgi:hypothetical protein